MASNQPIFVGEFSDAEMRITEFIFENAWSQASSAHLIHPDADRADHQRRPLALIATRMMHRRDDSSVNSPMPLSGSSGTASR